MAIDGDTAQVGPEVAGQLNLPQVTLLQSIDRIGPHEVHVTRNTGICLLQQRIELPSAMMVSKGVCALKAPDLKGWRYAVSQPIERWDAAALDIRPEEVGLYASPTQVVATHIPDTKKQTVWLASRQELEDYLEGLLNQSYNEERE